MFLSLIFGRMAARLFGGDQRGDEAIHRFPALEVLPSDAFPSEDKIAGEAPAILLLLFPESTLLRDAEEVCGRST